MLKRIAVRKDGTISMSEFRKFAEKYQGEIYRLEEENKKLKEYNKKLKSDLDFVYIEGKILNNDLCVLRKENKILKELIRGTTKDIK